MVSNSIIFPFASIINLQAGSVDISIVCVTDSFGKSSIYSSYLDLSLCFLLALSDMAASRLSKAPILSDRENSLFQAILLTSLMTISNRL